MGGGGPGRRRPMTEEEKKQARERRLEECKYLAAQLIFKLREEKTGGRAFQDWQKEEEEVWREHLHEAAQYKSCF